VLSKIDRDLVAHPITRPIEVFIGDYIDRGPSSRGVLDQLIERYETREMVFLMGNHELFLVNFLSDPAFLEYWRQFGGLDTLMSYGLTVPVRPTSAELFELSAALQRAMPSTHHWFLDQLELSFGCGGFFFVHAGIRPNVRFELQKKEDLLGIRDPFLKYELPFGKVVVHGHTPVARPDIRRNRINIDTGAYATGRLTCLVLETDHLRFL
jgi:serine/threonine protein phosphatase 1